MPVPGYPCGNVATPMCLDMGVHAAPPPLATVAQPQTPYVQRPAPMQMVVNAVPWQTMPGPVMYPAAVPMMPYVMAGTPMGTAPYGSAAAPYSLASFPFAAARPASDLQSSAPPGSAPSGVSASTVGGSVAVRHAAVSTAHAFTVGAADPAESVAPRPCYPDGSSALVTDGSLAAPGMLAEGGTRQGSSHSLPSLASGVGVLHPACDGRASVTKMHRRRKSELPAVRLRKVVTFIESTGRRPTRKSADPQEKTLGVWLHRFMCNDDGVKDRARESVGQDDFERIMGRIEASLDAKQVADRAITIANVETIAQRAKAIKALPLRADPSGCGKKLHNLRQGRLGPDVRDEAIAIVRRVLGTDVEHSEILSQLEEAIELSVSRHQEHGFAARRHKGSSASGQAGSDDAAAPASARSPSVPAIASAALAMESSAAAGKATGTSANDASAAVVCFGHRRGRAGEAGVAGEAGEAGEPATFVATSLAAATSQGHAAMGLPMDSLLIAATDAARAAEGEGPYDVTAGLTGDNERANYAEGIEVASVATAVSILSGACSPVSSSSLTTADLHGVIRPQRWRSDSSAATCPSMTSP